MSLYRLSLRRAFSAAVDPKPQSIRAISDSLYRERNLKTLVRKFKESSDLYRFRTKTPIYVETVRRLAAAKRFNAIEELLNHQKTYPNFALEGFAVRILSLFGKSGMLDQARHVFDEMPERNTPQTVLSLNALMGACVNSKKYDLAVEVFKETPGKINVEPDLVSYNTLIKAYCMMGEVENAVKVIETMEENGVKADVITFNTILDWLYGSKRFEEAEKVWDVMAEKNEGPDIRSYNAKLLGLALEKRSGEAAELVEEVKRVGLELDVFSFNAVIKGYVGEGNLEEAKRWYRELVKSERVVPDRWTFETLVPFACEKGDVEFGYELCKDIFQRQRLANAEMLQPVVDGLVKASMVEKAKELVQLGNTTNYKRFNLKLSSDE